MATSVTEHRFSGTEGQIFYRRWQPDDPRHIAVLAHGYGDHIGRWGHVGEALSGKGSVVYACDHLGHGQSEGEPGLVTDFDHVVDDVHHLAGIARQEHPGLPVVVAGHSMGGLIATRYAQRFGDELAGVVISAARIAAWPEAHDLLADDSASGSEWDHPLMTDDESSFRDLDKLSRDPEVGRRWTKDTMIYRGPYKPATLRAFLAAIERVGEEVDRVRVPVLYMHGDDDQLVPMEPARKVAERFASESVTIRVYPGARHSLYNEINKQEILDEVTGFIDRVTR